MKNKKTRKKIEKLERVDLQAKISLVAQFWEIIASSYDCWQDTCKIWAKSAGNFLSYGQNKKKKIEKNQIKKTKIQSIDKRVGWGILFRCVWLFETLVQNLGQIGA